MNKQNILSDMFKGLEGLKKSLIAEEAQNKARKEIEKNRPANKRYSLPTDYSIGLDSQGTNEPNPDQQKPLEISNAVVKRLKALEGMERKTNYQNIINEISSRYPVFTIEQSKQAVHIFKEGQNLNTLRDLYTSVLTEEQLKRVMKDFKENKNINHISFDKTDTGVKIDNIVFVKFDYSVGYTQSNGRLYPTNYLKIHYSKRGLHIVPVT